MAQRIQEMMDTDRVELTSTQRLEDVPELIHHIQSLIPVKDAARTCVLSKPWLHAWSTNPTLRFDQSVNLRNAQKQILYINLIDRTILRYFRDNIPITSIQLNMVIDDEQSYSLVKKWIRLLVSKSSITKIYLKLYIYISEFHLSDEVFTGENLKKVSLCIYTFSKLGWMNPISPITGSISSVRELTLEFMVIDGSISELFESKFPFLESLNLKFGFCARNILDIKCVSLKRLAIKARQHRLIHVQVLAPNLLSFHYTGGATIPSFVFPAIVPKKIELNLKLKKLKPSNRYSFCLKLRETLNLLSKFNITISTSYDFVKKFHLSIDYLRSQVPSLARNVQQLCFNISRGDGEDLRGHSHFFDSFFLVCNPSHIQAIGNICPSWKTNRHS